MCYSSLLSLFACYYPITKKARLQRDLFFYFLWMKSVSVSQTEAKDEKQVRLYLFIFLFLTVKPD